LSELNEATPLFEVVANSAAIVNVSPDCVVSIPSPPEIVKVSPKSIAFEPLSVETVTVELDNEELPIFDNVFEEASIVLLVNVCVPVVVTNVFGNVIVNADKSKVVASFAAVTFASVILIVVTAFVANSFASIPPALTLNASDETSIVLSSTCTSKVLPVFNKAAPSLIWPAPEN
jgi:hypothetical protein